MKSKAELIDDLKNQIKDLEKQEVFCNLCGLSCGLNNGPLGEEWIENHGLIEQKVFGGYASTPGNGDGALDDGDIYMFSLCEFCLDWLFVQFKNPPTVSSYISVSDEPEAWRPAEQRVREDSWRSMKDRFFKEFEKRNLARNKK